MNIIVSVPVDIYPAGRVRGSYYTYPTRPVDIPIYHTLQFKKFYLQKVKTLTCHALMILALCKNIQKQNQLYFSTYPTASFSSLSTFKFQIQFSLLNLFSLFLTFRFSFSLHLLLILTFSFSIARLSSDFLRSFSVHRNSMDST